MAKKIEQDFERAKREVKIAHQKKLETIERVADRAKDVETAVYEKKVLMLDQAAKRIAAAAAAASSKANAVTLDMSEKAEQAASTINAKASDVGEAVGAEVDVLGERAAQIRTKTGARLRQQPWIVGVAAAVLLLALGVSVGRRYFSPS